MVPLSTQPPLPVPSLTSHLFFPRCFNSRPTPPKPQFLSTVAFGPGPLIQKKLAPSKISRGVFMVRYLGCSRSCCLSPPLFQNVGFVPSADRRFDFKGLCFFSHRRRKSTRGSLLFDNGPFSSPRSPVRLF